jgi:signal transduction histidine kinase
MAIFGIAEAEVILTNARRGPLVANMLVVGLMALSLLWRRERPLATVATVVGGVILLSAVLTRPPDLIVAVVVLVVASYSAAAHLPQRRAFAGLVLCAGTILTVGIVIDPSDVFFPTVFFGVVPWLVGRILRNQTRLTRELAEKAERAQHAREEEERRAVVAERSRVARELHDVLAHDLSVMVIQAAAGRRVVERDPGAAAEAARLIERTGREALAELRQLFGPVRRGHGEALAGSPTLDQVERLVQRARDAGLPVELRVEGERRAVPPGVDLAAYRVVQEALTNTIKHAGKARATVRVRYGAGELAVEASDNGRGAGGGMFESGGHGLVGMRERVGLYGGEFQVGRRRGGGFSVRARFPLRGKVAA